MVSTHKYVHGPTFLGANYIFLISHQMVIILHNIMHVELL